MQSLDTNISEKIKELESKEPTVVQAEPTVQEPKEPTVSEEVFFNM